MTSQTANTRQCGDNKEQHLPSENIRPSLNRISHERQTFRGGIPQLQVLTGKHHRLLFINDTPSNFQKILASCQKSQKLMKSCFFFQFVWNQKTDFCERSIQNQDFEFSDVDYCSCCFISSFEVSKKIRFVRDTDASLKLTARRSK